MTVKSYLNTSEQNVTYHDFINNDLIHFLKYDNERSIPNIADGLKISLRKINNYILLSKKILKQKLKLRSLVDMFPNIQVTIMEKLV